MFSEGVEATFTQVTITGDGSAVTIKSIETAPGDQKTLIVTPEKLLTAGKYKVEWNATSIDTHKSDGDYGFTLGK